MVNKDAKLSMIVQASRARPPATAQGNYAPLVSIAEGNQQGRTYFFIAFMAFIAFIAFMAFFMAFMAFIAFIAFMAFFIAFIAFIAFMASQV